MPKFISFAFLLLVLVLVQAQSPCRFARLYTQEQLFTNATARQEYVEAVMYWEGKFHQDGIGINLASGMTYDGHPIDPATGEATGDPHLFSAPSKESIHVSLLAHILNGNPLAQILISNDSTVARQTAITILENKITSYEHFNAQWPGFGGYFPWVSVNDSGIAPDDGWESKVPSLDNGQLMWGLLALIQVLNTQNLTDLATRYQAQLDRMTQYASMVFYAGNGKVRTVTLIKDTTATPSADNYHTPLIPVYQNDPYEGELFVMYLTLFGGLTQDDIEKIWEDKLDKLKSVNYDTPLGPITVQKGWWYSAHEMWKYLLAPYQDVDLLNRVLKNGEKARTWDAYMHNLPGMFASINDVSATTTIPGYISAAGIPQIAFMPVERRDVVTGYSTFPLFLVNNVTALIWYDNYLKGPRGQNPYGATEAININGTLISPLTTWDSKMTTVLAMLGGVTDLTRTVLQNKGVYSNFIARLNETYSKVFTTFKGEDFPFVLPTITIPFNSPADLTSCNVTSYFDSIIM